MTNPELTSDIAHRLAAGWRELLSDDVLARVVGIKFTVLKQWLDDNERVTIVRTFKRISPTGEETKEHKTQEIGLSDLRDEKINKMEYELLQQYNTLIDKASGEKEKGGDIKAALRAIEWRLSKALPEKYGRDVQGTNINILDLPVID